MTVRYLVTGGAGFIGSNIVETLVERGDTVRVVDDFSTGKRANLDGLWDSIEFVEGDLADMDVARRAVESVDYVIHQAAIPSVPRSIADPIGNNRASVLATLSLLVAAREAGVKRLVYASSSSAYGEAVNGAKREDMPLQPLSPYGVAKLAAEHYCLSFHTVYGFETVALRYFNVFGPRQDPTSEYAAVIPRFITTMLAGKRPTIYGDGEQTRDFTYVGNIVAANLRALEAPGAAGQTFNIAMGQPNSLNQLVEVLCELTGADVKPVYAEARPGDIKHSVADVSKARRLLGFTPQISLVEGLGLTVGWFRKHG
ncbi:MAG: SDR family oxidoreductase [Chloroflexi bacterium]|nr:SDR family oxidoreductase [Chloroflexota bacterium]